MDDIIKKELLLFKTTLNRILKEKNISLRKLSVLSGVDYSCVVKLIRIKERDIRLSTILKILNSINMDLCEFVYEVNRGGYL